MVQSVPSYWNGSSPHWWHLVIKGNSLKPLATLPMDPWHNRSWKEHIYTHRIRTRQHGYCSKKQRLPMLPYHPLPSKHMSPQTTFNIFGAQPNNEQDPPIADFTSAIILPRLTVQICLCYTQQNIHLCQKQGHIGVMRNGSHNSPQKDFRECVCPQTTSNMPVGGGLQLVEQIDLCMENDATGSQRRPHSTSVFCKETQSLQPRRPYQALLL
jgi:hypothetical protein